VRGRLPFSQFWNVLGHEASGVIVGIVVILRSGIRSPSMMPLLLSSWRAGNGRFCVDL